MPATDEPLDIEAYRADIERAHTEVGDIAHDGRHRWRMSIPARPDRDSDLLISTGLARGDRLADEVERLRAERDHALGELSALRDHRTRWQTEHDRAERAAAAAKLALTALRDAETSCRYHGENPPEAPAWHGGRESCRQPTRVREAFAAIRALDGGA